MDYYLDDSTKEASGYLYVNDRDTGQSNFNSITSLDGNYGTFRLSSNGLWNYSLNENGQELFIGESLIEEFTVYSKDQTPRVVRFTVEGTKNVDPQKNQHTPQVMAKG